MRALVTVTIKWLRSSERFGIAALSLLLLAGSAAANEPAPAKPAAPPADEWPIEHTTTQPADEVERFCTNIADAARDRRYALQAQELVALQQEVDKRMKALDDKRAEYEAWMKKREEFIAQATDGVVKIYSGMKPDAAAERLAELDPPLAAGILMKLDSRKAGVILNEMNSKAAASLTGIMASSARRTDPS